MFFAMGDDLHSVSGFGEELVIFGAYFAGARFESSGAPPEMGMFFGAVFGPLRSSSSIRAG
jgi:hypothetical protein